MTSESFADACAVDRVGVWHGAVERASRTGADSRSHCAPGRSRASALDRSDLG